MPPSMHSRPLELRRPLGLSFILAVVHWAWRCHAGAPPIRSFDLSDVRLSPDTYQARAMASNTDYMMNLDPDRLLYVFRANAGLPTPGVPFHGTWEDPHCELRGHFVGHYLSALAYVALSTGAQLAAALCVPCLGLKAHLQACILSVHGCMQI
eukprot:365048-Chlamydomonas_euryale.AAC.18